MRNPAYHLLIPTLATAMLLSGFAVRADSHAARGLFQGASNHQTTGEVEIVKAADGNYQIVLGDNFSFDGAPDPRVGLGSNGKFDSRSDAGALASNSGGQSYAVPAGVDAKSYNEVYIWCRKYSVPLGVAKVK